MLVLHLIGEAGEIRLILPQELPRAAMIVRVLPIAVLQPVRELVHRNRIRAVPGNVRVVIDHNPLGLPRDRVFIKPDD